MTRYHYSVIVVLFLLFVGVASAAFDLPTPTIYVNPDIYYPVDEILYLEGRAKPNATLQIQFLKPGAKPLKLVTRSDQNGEWVLAERVPLEGGNWEVRARVIEAERTSLWSNPRIIKSIITGVTIGRVNIRFSAIAFLLMIAAGVIFYLFFRMRQVAREKTGLQIEQDFSELRRNVAEELRHLARKRSLSKEEEEHRDKLLRDLEHVEREINRRLKDI
ncbi:hypothetical protein IIA95_00465 [Patescibacteria group bacterium]|nr:hypothetical protein [Patescibacteria group bacterium]